MISAHDATRTWDCATPGCEGEANREGDVCTTCFLDGRNPPYERQVAPAVPETKEETMPEDAVVACRKCGVRAALPRLVGARGRYARLCAQCYAAEREKGKTSAKGRTPWNKGKRQKPERSPTAVKPPPVNGNQPIPIEAIRRLLTAAEQLVEARAEYERALAAIKAG